MALAWDFARQIDAAANNGNTTSYADGNAQAFYIDDGQIKTLVAPLSMGQWQDVAYGDELVISDPGYSLLDIEHHFPDVVFGAAVHDNDVVFLVYEYRLDTSSFIENGALKLQPDNAIKAIDIDLSQIAKNRLVDSNYSLFSPGALLNLSVIVGDTETPWLSQKITGLRTHDDTDSVTVSSRNDALRLLLLQTFNTNVTYTGTVAEIIAAVLLDAGITATQVDSNATATTATFTPDQTIFDGLSEFCLLYNWFVDALDDNTVIVGSESFLQALLPVTIHEFEEGNDIFSRQYKLSSEDTYSKVCVWSEEDLGGIPYALTNQRSGANPIKLWTGTQAQYDALGTYDPDTLYFAT